MPVHGGRRLNGSFGCPEGVRDLVTSERAANLLKDRACELGFDLAAVAPAATPLGWSAFVQWVRAGFAGQMHYIPKRLSAYRHPDSLLSGAKSVVMLAMNYNPAPARRVERHASGDAEPANASKPHAQSGLAGRVAAYARGQRDYHDLIRQRLALLAAFARRQFAGSRARGVVDTAPLLERDFGRMAGLGWFGKNTMLINRQLGSRFFLAALLLDVALDYDLPFEKDFCGTCTACLDACPTQAFVAPRVLDARRCISYLTIEHRGPIDGALRGGMQDWLFGCDVCQDVCPWNGKAPAAREPELLQRPDLQNANAEALLAMSEAQFIAKFSGTALERPGRTGLRRNAAIVLGNSRDPQALPALCAQLEDDDPVVRGAVAWALGQIGGALARNALLRRSAVENDAAVSKELLAALACCERLTEAFGGV
jgi:epoxyqueuosine reductase